VDYETVQRIKKKLIDERLDLLKEKINMGVDNWETYQYIIGQIRSLTDLRQDLTDLFKKQELNDDDNARGAGDQ
jgi:hypothetical protein